MGWKERVKGLQGRAGEELGQACFRAEAESLEWSALPSFFPSALMEQHVIAHPHA